MNTTTTRRGVIATMMTATIAASTGAVAMVPPNPDRELITAFQARQHALAAIEAKGDYFYAETHSPRAADLFDEAERIATTMKAVTLPGILAQLWIGLSHTGGQIGHETQRKRRDVFRRADLTAMNALNFDDFECDERIIANAIVNLAKIMEA